MSVNIPRQTGPVTMLDPTYDRYSYFHSFAGDDGAVAEVSETGGVDSLVVYDGPFVAVAEWLVFLAGDDGPFVLAAEWLVSVVVTGT